MQIDNTQRTLCTNSYSWRAVLFSRPLRWERRSALQLAEDMGRVRYSVSAADTGERIDVSLDMRLEECLRPAYRRIQVEEAWCLISILGESEDERGPEAQVLARLEASDEVLASIQVSSDRNMMLIGRVEQQESGEKRRHVLMYVSELVNLVQGEDAANGRWSLTSVDKLS